jgi:hypothetical protein
MEMESVPPLTTSSRARRRCSSEPNFWYAAAVMRVGPRMRAALGGELAPLLYAADLARAEVVDGPGEVALLVGEDVEHFWPRVSVGVWGPRGIGTVGSGLVWPVSRYVTSDICDLKREDVR